MTHFTDEELARWSQAGPGGDRARLLDHLQRCGACAARYAEAVRAARLGAHAFDAIIDSHDDIREYVDAAAPLVAPRRWRTAAWVGGLAAAAAIVAALVVPRSSPAPQPEPGVQLRGSGVTTLSPSGDVDRVAQFVWSSGLAAPRYIVEVGDDRAVLFSATSSESTLAAPGDIAKLTPGVEYWWTVAAIDADGQRIRTSERRTFRIRKQP